MIKAILFDFGGTLDNNGIDWFTRLQRLINQTGDPITRETFDLHGGRAAEGIDNLPDTRTLSMSQLAHRLIQYTHDDITETTAAAPAWNPPDIADAFIAESSENIRRNVDTLQQLSQRFRLGCISNNWGNTAGWCKEFDLDKLFEVMIDSTLVAAAKPDPRIFHAALNEMDLPPEECAYVGDRFDCDIKGAHAVGMTPIWITNSYYFGEVDNSVDPRRIKSLSDLLTADWL